MNQQFVKSILTLRGKRKGQKWIDKIPSLVKKYEEKWKIKVDDSFPELSINYVAPAITSGGKFAVLKIGFPGDQEFLSEMEVLKIYDGKGAVKILEIDKDNCILVLERCIPGNSLYTLNDEAKEVSIFVQVCFKIWKEPPVGSHFKHLSEEIKYFNWYFQKLRKHQQYLPEEMVLKAANLFDYLIKTQGELYLLHSDLHQDNILSSKRGYLAIDPKGLIGEREYETASFIRNPYRKFKNEKYINKDFFAQRISLISKALNFDEQRIAKWVYVKQCLSMIWDLQDFSNKDLISIKILKELEKLL